MLHGETILKLIHYFNMKIEHIAIWVNDLEAMRIFYAKYFGCIPGEKYTNQKKQYESYFLSFGDGATRLELMHRPDIITVEGQRGLVMGFAHISVSVGSRESVNELTELLRNDKYLILSEPRTTGDGYYESVVSDPEGNYLEITV
jgi:lactoylglutathione lyase